MIVMQYRGRDRVNPDRYLISCAKGDDPGRDHRTLTKLGNLLLSYLEKHYQKVFSVSVDRSDNRTVLITVPGDRSLRLDVAICNFFNQGGYRKAAA